MTNKYNKGIAFIAEGDTECQFYDALLKHYCKKHQDCSLSEEQDPANFETYYTLTGPFGIKIIRMNSVGTITQMHNSASWFNNICALKGDRYPWTVFLCYDTDEYNANITKFYQDDWQTFRARIAKRRAKRIIDLAADADIEDLMLLDLHGISRYMERKTDLTQDDIPKGRKGSARLKQLFIQQRALGETKMYYHKGDRARALIDCLDMDVICAGNLLQLDMIERECFDV